MMAASEKPPGAVQGIVFAVPLISSVRDPTPQLISCTYA